MLGHTNIIPSFSSALVKKKMCAFMLMGCQWLSSKQQFTMYTRCIFYLQWTCRQINFTWHSFPYCTGMQIFRNSNVKKFYSYF